jgi:hypothetical protein
LLDPLLDALELFLVGRSGYLRIVRAHRFDLAAQNYLKTAGDWLNFAQSAEQNCACALPHGFGISASLGC